VDATLIPFIENRLNFSYGCYGCREATDIGEDEAVLGFPGHKLEEILHNLEGLGDKAIANARAKKTFRRLKEQKNDVECE
jgi:uncharacterized protein (DUF169 family)